MHYGFGHSSFGGSMGSGHMRGGVGMSMGSGYGMSMGSGYGMSMGPGHTHSHPGSFTIVMQSGGTNHAGSCCQGIPTRYPAVGLASVVVAAVMFTQASAAEARQRDIEFEDFLSSVKRDTAVYRRRHDRYFVVACVFVAVCIVAMISCVAVHWVARCQSVAELAPGLDAAHVQAQESSAAAPDAVPSAPPEPAPPVYGAIAPPCESGNVPGDAPPPYPDKAEPQPACYGPPPPLMGFEATAPPEPSGPK
eukprot:m51a1_g9905 hypothetical protein (249) ;mRNA; r:87565-88522